MMCTTTSPRSTSTHSPASVPSTLITWPPASLTFSTTLEASARVCRLEVPLAMTTRSNSSVSPVVLKTLMSWALTSSRASTTRRCSLRRSIRLPIQVMGANIVEHRRRHDLGQTVVARGGGRLRQQRADLGGRGVDRSHLDLDDAAARRLLHR